MHDSSAIPSIYSCLSFEPYDRCPQKMKLALIIYINIGCYDIGLCGRVLPSKHDYLGFRTDRLSFRTHFLILGFGRIS